MAVDGVTSSGSSMQVKPAQAQQKSAEVQFAELLAGLALQLAGPKPGAQPASSAGTATAASVDIKTLTAMQDAAAQFGKK